MGLCKGCLNELPRQIQKVSTSNCELVCPFWALMPYEGAGGAIVRQIKSRGDLWLANQLAQRLSVATLALEPPAAVIAIPSTAKRMRERGFNLADILAHHIAKRLQVTYLPNVLRRLDEGHQAQRSPKERRHHLGRRFECLVQNIPERIMVVDDVHTSGGTLDAAAIALLNRCSYVSGVALASRQL